MVKPGKQKDSDMIALCVMARMIIEIIVEFIQCHASIVTITKTLWVYKLSSKSAWGLA